MRDGEEGLTGSSDDADVWMRCARGGMLDTAARCGGLSTSTDGWTGIAEPRQERARQEERQGRSGTPEETSSRFMSRGYIYRATTAADVSAT